MCENNNWVYKFGTLYIKIIIQFIIRMSYKFGNLYIYKI